MRKSAILALLLLPLAAADAVRTRTIADESLANAAPLGEWTGKPPSLADVDGDGLLDFVGQNANGRVYAIDPRSAALLVEVAPRYPYGPDLGPFNGARAADLDGDGVVELVSVNRAAVVSVWHLPLRDGAPVPELAWDRHLDDHHARPSADAGPVLGDVDGDGALDILVQTEETGVYALRADGTTLWSLATYGGNAEPRIADVDRDGDPDVVFFTDGGIVHAVEGRTGAALWRFDATRHGVWPASITSPGVVADIDGDGSVEVVVCTRNIEGGTPERAPRPLSQHHFVLFAIRAGELVWKAKPDWGNPLCAAYLLSFDADGDGKREIYGMDWNTVGHKPGDWERSDESHAFAFRHDGTEIWRRAENSWNAKANVAAADWTGDGVVDLIVYGAARLDVLDARTGALLDRVGLGGDPIQGPLVADLDADGDADAIVAVAARLEVLDTRAPISPGGWPGWDPVAPGSGPPKLAPPVVTPSGANESTATPAPPADPGTAAQIPLGPALLPVAVAAASLASRRKR